MFVRTIPESSLVKLLNVNSDVLPPAANVELLQSVTGVWAPPGKDLNFWDSNLAHLTRIDIPLQNQLWDPNKYIFSERVLAGASTG